MRASARAAGVLLTAAAAVCAGQECSPGQYRITGQVLDTTGAAIVTAAVLVEHAGGLRIDAQGQFATCLAVGHHALSIAANGFNPVQLKVVAGPESRPVLVRLKPLIVETIVEAENGDGGAAGVGRRPG